MDSKAWAAVALMTAAASAQAQSSVTIFGLVDLNARSVTTGSNTVRQLATDGNSFSRLGFKAEEDLGGGLRAGVWLESAITPDTGTINASGKFWHRRSTVSLFTPYARGCIRCRHGCQRRASGRRRVRSQPVQADCSLWHVLRDQEQRRRRLCRRYPSCAGRG